MGNSKAKSATKKGSTVVSANGEVRMFRPSQLTIVKDTAHPLYDERVSLKPSTAMVANVAMYGVLEPVIVAEEDGKMLVVAGRQRVKAVEQARKVKKGLEVPCIVRNDLLKQRRTAMAAVVSENEIRRDDDPLTKQRKMKRMLDEGIPKEVVAISFGVTPQSVDNAKRILSCSPRVLKAVREREIGTTHALQIYKLDHKAQDDKLDELQGVAKSNGKAKPTVKGLNNAVGGGLGKSGKANAGSTVNETPSASSPSRKMKTKEEVTKELDKTAKAFNRLSDDERMEGHPLDVKMRVLEWVLGEKVYVEQDDK